MSQSISPALSNKNTLNFDFGLKKQTTHTTRTYRRTLDLNDSDKMQKSK